jgi:hypothetical protein
MLHKIAEEQSSRSGLFEYKVVADAYCVKANAKLKPTAVRASKACAAPADVPASCDCFEL